MNQKIKNVVLKNQDEVLKTIQKINIVEFHDDPNIIIPISNRIKRGNLIIFISLNGETYFLLKSGQVTLKTQVPTITITTNNQEKLINYSKIAFINYKQKSSFFPEFEVHSRLALEVISRILLDSYTISIQK